MSSSIAEPATRRDVLCGMAGGALASVLCQPGFCTANSIESGASSARSIIKFSDARGGTSWIAFEMPDERRIMIPGRINGVPARILLDSGVSGLILNKTIASALSLRATGSVTGVGVTGLVPGQALEGVSISFDTLTIQTPASVVYDLSPFEGAMGEPIAALLGGFLFESLVVDIDFANSRIGFRDPSAEVSFPGGSELPLQQDRFGLRSFSISVDNGPPIHATLDLGLDRALIVSPALAVDRGLLKGKKTSTTLSAGVAGSQEGQVAVLAELRVGQATFHQVPFEVPGAWTFSNQAVVGIPVLRRTRLLMDFPHNRVQILPNASLLLRPFRKDRSGLGARRLADRLKVMHVAAGSPAAAAGLNTGDEIIAINDEALNADYFRKHPRDGSGPAGTILQLTLSDHRMIKLVLADYF